MASDGQFFNDSIQPAAAFPGPAERGDAQSSTRAKNHSGDEAIDQSHIKVTLSQHLSTVDIIISRRRTESQSCNEELHIPSTRAKNHSGDEAIDQSHIKVTLSQHLSTVDIIISRRRTELRSCNEELHIPSTRAKNHSGDEAIDQSHSKVTLGQHLSIVVFFGWLGCGCSALLGDAQSSTGAKNHSGDEAIDQSHSKVTLGQHLSTVDIIISRRRTELRSCNEELHIPSTRAKNHSGDEAIDQSHSKVTLGQHLSTRPKAVQMVYNEKEAINGTRYHLLDPRVHEGIGYCLDSLLCCLFRRLSGLGLLVDTCFLQRCGLNVFLSLSLTPFVLSTNGLAALSGLTADLRMDSAVGVDSQATAHPRLQIIHISNATVDYGSFREEWNNSKSESLDGSPRDVCAAERPMATVRRAACRSRRWRQLRRQLHKRLAMPRGDNSVKT
ncbi:hypothetical protein J6590_011230 [Homalodisca vitripennis]|nr:hypothetical protein J6590_011230 [Homalodisca vitripennis]